MNDLTAARKPIKLGGREFLMTRFSDRDISEIDQWLRARIIRDARESLDANSTHSERAEILEIAMRMAAVTSMYSPIGARMIATVDGMAKMLLQSIHRDHPNETVESLRQLLFDQENLDVVNQEWKDLNTGDAVANSDKKGGAETIKEKKKRRKSLQK